MPSYVHMTKIEMDGCKNSESNALGLSREKLIGMMNMATRLSFSSLPELLVLQYIFILSGNPEANF